MAHVPAGCQAGAERRHGSSISHDDPSHCLAASMEKMASEEQHAESQRLARGPGDTARCPTAPHHLHTRTPLQHPAGRGAPGAWLQGPFCPGARAKIHRGLPSPVPWSLRGSRGTSAPGPAFWVVVCSTAVHPQPSARARVTFTPRIRQSWLLSLPQLLQKGDAKGQRLGIGSGDECVSTTGTGTWGNQAVPCCWAEAGGPRPAMPWRAAAACGSVRTG